LAAGLEGIAAFVERSVRLGAQSRCRGQPPGMAKTIEILLLDGAEEMLFSRELGVVFTAAVDRLTGERVMTVDEDDQASR